MSSSKHLGRRRFIQIGVLGGASAAVISACGETITVTKEVPVEVIKEVQVAGATVVKEVKVEVAGETVIKEVEVEVVRVEEVIKEVPVEIIKEVEVAAAQPVFVELSVIGGPEAGHLQFEVDAFMEANPNVVFKVNVTADSIAYKVAAPQLFASGDRPDVAWYWVDAKWYQNMAKAGILENLNDLWEREKWVDVLPPSTVEAYTFTDGNYYAVNIDVVLYPFIYNMKEHFDAAGIDLPGRWMESMEDFYAAAEEFRAIGLEPLTYGGKEGWIVGHNHDAMLQKNVPEAKMSELQSNWREGAETQQSFIDPDVLGVHEAMAEMRERRVYADGFLGRNFGDGRGVFTAGKAAMFQDGSWSASEGLLYGEMGEGSKDAFDWMVYPRMRADVEPQMLTYSGNALMIPKDGLHQDVTQEYIAWVMSKERNGSAAAYGVIPSRLDVEITDDMRGLLGPHVSSMLDILPSMGAAQGWDAVVPADLADYSMTLLQEMLAGSREPASVGEELEAVAERLRAGE